MKQLQTQLADRILRYDGVSIVEPDQLVRLLLLGVTPSQVRLVKHDADTEYFNRLADPGDALQLVADEPVRLSMAWQLPNEYLELDLTAYVSERFSERFSELGATYNQQQYEQSLDRIANELEQIKLRGMDEFFKTIIYILDQFKKHGVIWGVGRGSSCACYILFILGLHSVDCIKLDVPMEEFFHD